MKDWNIRTAWNASVKSTQRPLVPRDYIYASELGAAHIDTILKMRAVTPTNPPNDRALRKFFCGNIFEDVLYLTLLRCGLIIEAQKRGKYQYKGLLEVSGRCDFIAGGRCDYEKALAGIKEMKLSEQMESLSIGVLTEISSKLGDAELKPLVVECKSVASQMFSKYEKTEKANPSHINQCFHYLKSFGMDEGRIFYVSKDDALLMEFPLFNPSPAEDLYKNEITILTDYYSVSELPPKEPEVFFDELLLKFSKNWKVEYSNYLEMLYGYKMPEDYRLTWDKTISSFNRTFKRCVTGANMTKLNLSTIETAKKIFPEWDTYVDMGKLHKEEIAQEVEETEE